jgi:DNA-binding HxlR family transcriptional regulator
VTQSLVTPLAPDRSIGEALQLIGSEPAGSILMVLGQRAIRTKQLTKRITNYSSRSIYRSLGKLEAFGLVEHRQEPDTPSQVLLCLTKPVGRNLFHLVGQFKSESVAGRASEEVGLSWKSLSQLGEMWEWGFASELGHGSRSLANLQDGSGGRTYHQVKRRASQHVDAGLLSTTLHNSCDGRHYELTERSRRHMVMIASLGRWRHRYLLADGTPGLEIQEMATMLQVTLPLVTLAAYGGKSIDFVVAGAEDKYGRRDTADLRGGFGGDGMVGVGAVHAEEADGSATATVNTWFAALLDGNRGRIRVRGDLLLVDDCLTRLYDELWAP